MTKIKTIGKYEILRLLGKGSMGEVYLGRDNVLGREVAIKVIQPTTAFDAEGKVRFEREAQAMAALNHPHIITIFDFGVVEQGHFLAMEYLEGEELGTLIQQGQLEKRVLLEALAQACEGLGFAHGRGIIHRDVKPGNIQVAFSGGRPMAKLLDFGVASVDRSNLTETGVRMGTVSYMAPEYLETGKSTPSSDLFAVGVIIYEILSGGRKPFQGEGTTAILSAILRKPVEPLTPIESQGVAPAILNVMDKALAKDPAYRFTSAEELVKALREALLAPVLPFAKLEAQRIVVGKGGDCLSLRVALRQARPGAVISVLPGVYKETIFVDKEVTFQGDGDSEGIIVESMAGPSLTVNAPACTVRGITLQHHGGGPALDILSGNATVEACGIDNLRVASGASATLESCEVCSPGNYPGILLETGASLFVGRSTVSSPLGVGLLLHPAAKVTGEESRFENCPAGSVELGPGSSGQFLRCSFLGSRFAGVLAFQGALVTLEDCLLSGHEGAGVHAMAGTQVTLTGCRILDNAGMGISVVDAGRANLDDCDISANGQPGILLHRGGTARLSRCRVTDGKSLGVACHQDSSLALEGSVIRGNALGGILLGSGAGNPELSEGNVLEDSVLR